MQQLAALDEFFAAHPQWEGQVKVLVVNQGGAESGVEVCGNISPIAVVQDDTDGHMWNGLGSEYNAVTVVDQEGVLIQKFSGIDFSEASDHPGELENAVDLLLN